MYRYQLQNGDNLNVENNCVCPYCHMAVSNKVHDLVPCGDNMDKFFLIVECPNCQSIYYLENKIIKYSSNKYGLLRSFPPNIQLDLPPTIRKNFPEFVEIYRQSLLAQNDGLDEIAGMGFRKAVEYLVKPYVKTLYSDKEDDINQETLGKTIARIEFPLIKNLAKAATWLGNDQTHTQQWHTDYNVEDIKKFIK